VKSSGARRRWAVQVPPLLPATRWTLAAVDPTPLCTPRPARRLLTSSHLREGVLWAAVGRSSVASVTSPHRRGAPALLPIDVAAQIEPSQGRRIEQGRSLSPSPASGGGWRTLSSRRKAPRFGGDGELVPAPVPDGRSRQRWSALSLPAIRFNSGPMVRWSPSPRRARRLPARRVPPLLCAGRAPASGEAPSPARSCRGVWELRPQQ
jgi:hypothetical protein